MTNNDFAEQKVLYRDVLQMRISIENSLIANEQPSLPLRLVRSYRSLLLTQVPADEQISVADAVCLLRDVLVLSHDQNEQSWADLALELNSLFDKGNFKLFTLKDLEELMRGESSECLSFAPPIALDEKEGDQHAKKPLPAKPDSDPAAGPQKEPGAEGGPQGKGQSEDPEKAKADPNGAETQAQPKQGADGAQAGAGQKEAELQAQLKDLQELNEKLKAQLAQKQPSEAPVYTAKSQNGEYINWLSLVGKTVKIDDLEYLVSKGPLDKTVILVAQKPEPEIVDPTVFNDQMLNIKEIDIKPVYAGRPAARL